MNKLCLVLLVIGVIWFAVVGTVQTPSIGNIVSVNKKFYDDYAQYIVTTDKPLRITIGYYNKVYFESDYRREVLTNLPDGGYWNCREWVVVRQLPDSLTTNPFEKPKTIPYMYNLNHK